MWPCSPKTLSAEANNGLGLAGMQLFEDPRSRALGLPTVCFCACGPLFVLESPTRILCLDEIIGSLGNSDFRST